MLILLKLVTFMFAIIFQIIAIGFSVKMIGNPENLPFYFACQGFSVTFNFLVGAWWCLKVKNNRSLSVEEKQMAVFKQGYTAGFIDGKRDR